MVNEECMSPKLSVRPKLREAIPHCFHLSSRFREAVHVQVDFFFDRSKCFFVAEKWIYPRWSLPLSSLTVHKTKETSECKNDPIIFRYPFSAPLCCLIYWWRKNCTNCDLLSSSQGALCRIYFTARSVNEFGLEIKLTGAELGELKHNLVDLHHISPPGNRLFDKTVLD